MIVCNCVNEYLVRKEVSEVLQYVVQGHSTIATMEKLLHFAVLCYVEYHEENPSLYARLNAVLLLKNEIAADRATSIADQRGWISEAHNKLSEVEK